MTRTTRPIRIHDTERRRLLVLKHRLDRSARDALEATEGVVALHSTDPATPCLSVRARVAGFETVDLDRALLEDRMLWRLHAMRRTLFVVPAADAWVFQAGAARDVARRERARVEGWLAAMMDAAAVPAFMARLEARVLEVLADGTERRTQELTAAIPELATELTLGSGKWATRSPLSSRLLFLLAMDGRIARTRAAGSWRSSQYYWAAADGWFGAPPEPGDPASARAELARRYLAAYGPATLDDVRWWTGWTARDAKAAIAGLDTVPAALDDGREGMVLAGDADPAPAAAPGDANDKPGVALLPALDPTPMGWRHRDWFLGETGPRLFDTNGNVGPTVWLGGRVVGGWAQRPSGEVVYELMVDPGREAELRIGEAAAALESWLNGVVVVPRFRTPAERELSKRG